MAEIHGFIDEVPRATQGGAEGAIEANLHSAAANHCGGAESNGTEVPEADRDLHQRRLPPLASDRASTT
ncbi:MAG: hypothetical protein QM784_38655 [Polyangiaceae bacterium]